MALRMTHESVDELDACLRRRMLAFVVYPGHGPRCFSYPQYLFADDEVRVVSPSAFPDNGCLPMVAIGMMPAQMRDRFGTVCVMYVNSSELRENRFYGAEQMRYNAAIKPSLPHGESVVEFVPLREDALSSELAQAIRLDGGVDLSRPADGPVHLAAGECPPLTRRVVVLATEGGHDVAYGPFDCSDLGEGAVTLESLAENDRMVFRFDPSCVETLQIDDDRGMPVVFFLPYGELCDAIADAPRIDWVSDSELRDVLGRIAHSDGPSFTRNQVRELKAAIARVGEEVARLNLTPERRERLEAIVGDYESWSELPEDVKESVLTSASPQELEEFVLSDDHFRRFYEKVMESDQVNERVRQATAESNERAEVARAAAEAAEADLADIEARRDERVAELRETVARESAEAERRRDELASQADAARTELDRLRADKAAVEDEVEVLISWLSDERVLSQKIMESELVRNVVSALETAGANTVAAPSIAAPLRRDADELSDALVVADLFDRIGVRSGRDYSRNQVINLMICLTQGYVTTLAGMPGTGKTSLVQLVADALGLTDPAAPRLCEIPVERGWTSYKDFVGYYNPFTRTMEKSNVAAFDAFTALDAECRRGDEAAPFLFLLDEANLSSIEHYWSPFLRTCDSFERRPTVLSLGSSEGLTVPPYVRFVATVNFDHTTEELSPRFLDRSWVITLDPVTLDFDIDSAVAADVRAESAYSAARLREVFGARPDDIMPDEMRSKLASVLSCCEEHGWPVSPRSQRMMRGYICAASRTMGTTFADSAYAPVDFAVAQKVLPQISGSEERVGELLRALVGIGGLPLCRRRLDRMIGLGADDGFYQYFA